VLTIPKKEAKAGRGDEWWLFTVLAVIGETMDQSGEEVCGCVVSIRKAQDRIALWLKSCDKKACTEVGARWKKCLEVSNKTGLKYQAHKDGEVGSCFLPLSFCLLSCHLTQCLATHHEYTALDN
jgi:translation initiation factor 4E